MNLAGFSVAATMRMVLIVMCAALALGDAAAAEIRIDDFFGRWLGEGVAETEVGEATERQSRGLEVIVRDHPVGFQLCWSTTRHRAGESGRQTFAMMLFAPGAAPGTWKAVFSADGSETSAQADAVLEDDTLRVTNRATNEAGETEVQIYDRSLRRGGMDLHFTRFDDGRLVRIVQGRLESAQRRDGDNAPWC